MRSFSVQQQLEPFPTGCITVRKLIGGGNDGNRWEKDPLLFLICHQSLRVAFGYSKMSSNPFFIYLSQLHNKLGGGSSRSLQKIWLKLTSADCYSHNVNITAHPLQDIVINNEVSAVRGFGGKKENRWDRRSSLPTAIPFYNESLL